MELSIFLLSIACALALGFSAADYLSAKTDEIRNPNIFCRAHSIKPEDCLAYIPSGKYK